MGVDNSVIELITLRSSIATNTLREERIGRRAYLVAPVVAVVAGVLNGALLPVEEVDKLPDAWNGRPLVNDHPHSDDGYMSANAPGVLAGAWLGQVFGAYVEDDRLKGEAWFDLEMAESIPGGSRPRPHTGAGLSRLRASTTASRIAGFNVTSCLTIWQSCRTRSVHVLSRMGAASVASTHFNARRNKWQKQ